MKSFAVVAAFVAAANAYAYNTTTAAESTCITTTVASTESYVATCTGSTEISINPTSTLTVTSPGYVTIPGPFTTSYFVRAFQCGFLLQDES
jgi:uncharacterized membrane-anchored protein